MYIVCLFSDHFVMIQNELSNFRSKLIRWKHWKVTTKNSYICLIISHHPFSLAGWAIQVFSLSIHYMLCIQLYTVTCCLLKSKICILQKMAFLSRGKSTWFSLVIYLNRNTVYVYQSAKLIIFYDLFKRNIRWKTHNLLHFAQVFQVVMWWI